MNVLLITYSFPPAGGVGVLRALSLAKYLPENDVRLDVLTTRNAAAVGQDASLAAQVPAAVTVHRTWTPDLPFALRKALKKFIAPGRTTPARATAGEKKPGFLKSIIGNLLLPDPQVGWLPIAVRAAHRIVRNRHIDAVVVTVPPFSSVRLVTRLRRLFPHLAIVVDFRDEWLSTTIDLVSFNNNARARQVAERAESEAVRDATAVVCVTKAAVGELRKRYPDASPKLHCIPNGFDFPLRRAGMIAGPTDQPILLTYLGTVYGSTDPSTLVEAVLQLAPEIRKRLRLRFIGHIESPVLREKLFQLGDNMELVGFLPQAEALRSIDTSTYLLLISHDPINVSAKLYDYLGSGRPILAAVHPGGDIKRILETTHAGWTADVSNPAAIAALLTEAVERTSQPDSRFEPNTDEIENYHRRPLTACYAQLLRDLVSQRNV